MAYGAFSFMYGYPFKGISLKLTREFLGQNGLQYDEGIQFTVNLYDHDGEIIATGSLESNVIKCVAISEEYQGEGLSASVMTHLMTYALQKGLDHLFIFTKPENEALFSGLGFYPVAATREAVLMENVRDGLQNYLKSLPRPEGITDVGAIVVNCNPFTNGHLYLIEKAASACQWLHIFVLAEDKSVFRAEVRHRLVREGVSHIKNVTVHSTSDYLISSATFPSYFIKERADADKINCTLDLTMFRDHFARELGIRKRFVGTEPLCPVTAAYNSQMKEFFKGSGIEIIEVPRVTSGGEAISASRVRRLMAAGDYEGLKSLVPPVTYSYITSEEGRKLAETLRNNYLISPGLKPGA